MHRTIIALAGLTTTVALGAPPAHYTVTDLGELGGPIAARAINNEGTVVGNAILDTGAYRGFVSDSPVPVALAPVAGYTQSEAADIDDGGRVLALSYSLGRIEPRALLVDGKVSTDLGGFQPHAIDPNGAVVGGLPTVLSNAMRGQDACVWAEGVLSTLPHHLGSTWAAASDSDGNGLVVGWATPAGALRPVAVVWNNGATPVALGTLGGAMSQAVAISPARLVVGVSTNASNMPHAFACQLAPDGTPGAMTDLGALDAMQSSALGVNAAGDVVGTSAAHAFLSSGGQLVDLNTLIDANAGWNLVGAAGINDAGQIVGWGTHSGTHRSAYLLTPDTGCPADLAAPFGVLNFFDIQAYIGLYNAGCP